MQFAAWKAKMEVGRWRKAGAGGAKLAKKKNRSPQSGTQVFEVTQ